MNWTDESRPTINNESTSYEESELAFAKLREKYEENNEFLRLNNQKLDRLGEVMNSTLNEEQTTNKNYRPKILGDVENETGR